MSDRHAMVVRGVEKRAAILRAALTRFARYGFRRTSMEDIAREADISRAAIYLQFRNKEEIFRALARQLQEQALTAATAAANAPGAFDARLLDVLEAKMAGLLDVVHGSAHAAELLDENNRICGDISADAARQYLQLLAGVIATAVRRKELVPRRAGLSAAGAAEMIVRCAEGLKSGGAATLAPETYRRRLEQLVRVVVAGLGGTVTADGGALTRAARRRGKEERV